MRPAENVTAIRQHARALHRQTLVWDNHLFLSFGHIAKWHEDLGKLCQSDVNIVSVNIGDSLDPYQTVVERAQMMRAFVAQHPDRYVMVADVGDIIAAQSSGRLAITLDVEGAFSIDDDLSRLDIYYELGVRWMALVYNRCNRVGGGVHDDEDVGLTPFGRDLVRQMDEIGLVKCCSHTGYRTAMDVLAETDRPTIFSHSNPRRLWNHPRNIPDELIDACAATGGVVCLNGVGIFLGHNDPSVARLADHIEYVLDRAGPAHVGLGLDCMFDHGELEALVKSLPSTWPAGWGYDEEVRVMEPALLPELTETLLRRGRSETEIVGLLGGNLLRVAREVWR